MKDQLPPIFYTPPTCCLPKLWQEQAQQGHIIIKNYEITAEGLLFAQTENFADAKQQFLLYTPSFLFWLGIMPSPFKPDFSTIITNNTAPLSKFVRKVIGYNLTKERIFMGSDVVSPSLNKLLSQEGLRLCNIMVRCWQEALSQFHQNLAGWQRIQYTNPLLSFLVVLKSRENA